MSHDGGSSCKSYIKHPTEKERLDNLAFTSFPEDYLPYTSSYHRKAPYLVWDDGFRPHRKRRLKRWRQSRACRCCTAAALTAAISLIIIGILSIVAVSIYLGVITSLFRSPILSLSGKMSIREGDEFSDSLLNTTSYEFLTKAEAYQGMLENIYLSSSLQPAFVAAKVYAFRKGNLTVFFRIYLDRRKLLQSDEETILIARNVIVENAVKRRPEFRALTLDLKSIEMRENNNEEQTPEVDFDLYDEFRETGNVFDEEGKYSHVTSYPRDSDSAKIHSNTVQKSSTPAQGNAHSYEANEEGELRITLPGHTRLSSTTVITPPSHTAKPETTVLPETPLADDSNISITYGQWQPLVPLRKPTAVNTTTKRPPAKDHRRIPGSGSVHLVEEVFIPVDEAQAPPPHNIPSPGISDSSKSQPNVASTIMSSVSLVIRPSSKNRTLMVSSNKNNVIETVVKPPTPQPGGLKLLDSLHSGHQNQTSHLSVGTRNEHASLRFLEDFDRTVNAHTKGSTNENAGNGTSGTQQYGKTFGTSSTTTEEPFDSQVLRKAIDSKVPNEMLLVPEVQENSAGRIEDTLTSSTLATKGSADMQDSNSKGYFPQNEGIYGSDTPASSDWDEETESHEGRPNITSVDATPPSGHGENTNGLLSSSSNTSTGQAITISIPKIDSNNYTSVLSSFVEGDQSEDYGDDEIYSKEDAALDSEYDDFAFTTTTDVLLTDFKLYMVGNDSDSSGFSDVDSTVFPSKSNPKTNITGSSDNLHTSAQLPFNINSQVIPHREPQEFLQTYPGVEYVDKSNDSYASFTLNEDLLQTKGGSDSSRSDTDSPEVSFVREEFEEAPNKPSPTEEMNVTADASFNEQQNPKTNISMQETALNGGNSSDPKTGGLPKIVPPFTNTQYIPNDIHSDDDLNKNDDNHLDDEKLLLVTLNSIHVETPDMQPSNEQQADMNNPNSPQPPDDDENVVIQHITTPMVSLENDSSVVGLGKYPSYFLNKCSEDEMACRSGECIPADYQCNMRRDCRDNSDEEECTCSDNLRVIGQTQKICDGIQDCWDLSDEENCPWCVPGQFICPQSKLCIEMDQVCDGSNDCPSGTDERYCVKLASDESSANSPDYQATGYLMIRKQGQWGKLCLENLHSLAKPESLKVKLGELGQAVCSALSYKEISEAVETKDEAGTTRSYFEISTQLAKKQSRQYTDIFQPSECQSKSVVRVTCKNLECGMRPMAFSLRRRIVGGQSTNSGSWPWQVALYKEGDFQCGAVLVSDVWLISAGHCFYSSLNSHWTARLGVLRRGTELPSPTEQVRRVTHIFIHPDYVDKGFINDIALLRMESPVPFSDFLRPICLPDETEEVNMWHGHHCSVVGWGKLYEIGHTFPDSLQEVRLPVISTEECRKKILFLTMYHLTDNMFCAGYERGGRDACLGDSGGPLMCQRQDGRWVLLGVTSNGDGCGRPARPGVYTKVTNYLDWIKKVLEENLPPEQPSTCAGHRCNLGHCVSESKVCDGRWDCSDGSDEINCFI